MANFVLPVAGRLRQSYPSWSLEAMGENPHGIAPSIDMTQTKKGLLFVGDKTAGWADLPIASGLPADSVEVLIVIEKIASSVTNYANTGGGIYFGSGVDSAFNKKSYQLALSSQKNTEYSVRAAYLTGTAALLASASLAGINNLLEEKVLRARRQGSTLSFKIWNKGSAEPVSWGITLNNSDVVVDSVGFFCYSDSQSIRINQLAYATNGDTATFDLPPVVDIVAGNVPDSKAGDIVNIHDLATHDIVESIALPRSGSWQSTLYDNRPVYARIERASGSEYDLLFAKYGGTYLGGDYPDGSLKDDGVPSTGEVSILYKSDDPILGGATIAKVSAQPSGEWRVSGLQPNVPFDVVARKPDRKDVVVSGVVGVPDPDFKFVLMGGVSYANGQLNGVLLAKGASEPLTATLNGVTPYSLTDDNIAVDGNTIDINYPMRDYGSFDFDLNITDNNLNTKTQPISISNASRANFVDVVSVVSTTNSSFTITQINVTVPSSVQAGDLLVLSIASHSTTTTVTDDSGKVWVLHGSSAKASVAPIKTHIYTRQAIATDSGRVLLLKNSEAAVLIACLLVIRGKFSQLKVIKAIANDAQYGNYQQLTKPLTPIAHQSGFIVRAISSWYASATPTAKKEVIGMINALPVAGEPSRLQVAYKHEGSPGTLSDVMFVSDADNAANITPDMAIIIDEVRP